MDKTPWTRHNQKDKNILEFQPQMMTQRWANPQIWEPTFCKCSYVLGITHRYV